MFPTIFSGYNTVILAQPAFPVQPVFLLTQPLYQAGIAGYGIQQPAYVFFQPTFMIHAPVQQPIQNIMPQGIFDDVYGKMAEKEVQSLPPTTSSTQGTSSCSSPCSCQKSSSGYSSEGNNDINGLVQYNFEEEPPLPKRLPVFEGIHRKGLLEQMGVQKNEETGWKSTCPEEKIRKVVPRKFKTSLCKYFKDGKCNRGSKCTFAHGIKELRVVQLPPNYRTRPCANFMLKGRCPLGNECDFVHEM